MNSKGQTLPHHDQSLRFDNVTHMVNYVCVEMLVGPPPGRAERPLTEYVPICSFPYVPRGWMLNQINETAPETDSFAKGVSLTGFEDVQLNDCSITISEAFVGYGSSSMSYNMQCVVLCFAAFLPTILCLWFLKLGNDKKKKKKNKYFFLPNNPNQSEKMLLLGSVLGVFHTCRSIDPSGYADRLRIEDFYTCCTAICQWQQLDELQHAMRRSLFRCIPAHDFMPLVPQTWQ